MIVVRDGHRYIEKRRGIRHWPEQFRDCFRYRCFCGCLVTPTDRYGWHWRCDACGREWGETTIDR